MNSTQANERGQLIRHSTHESEARVFKRWRQQCRPPCRDEVPSQVVDRFNGSNCVPFAWAVRAHRTFKPRIRAVVAQYEAEHAVFAWKHPDSRRHLWRLHRYFANPRYVFVYRDIFAIANRKCLVHQRGVLASMAASLWDYAKILFFIQAVKPYALHVSYEKLLTNRESFVEALAAFCDRTVDAAELSRIRERISPSPTAYLQWSDRSRQMLALEKHGYKGLAEEVTATTVAGWAFQVGRAEAAVVEVFVNGICRGRAVADRFAERLSHVAGDLRKGAIRFEFTWGATPLTPGDSVDVRFEGTAYSLVGCPATVA